MLLQLIQHPLNINQVFKTLTGDNKGVFKNLKIVVPLKYLSNF